MATAILPPRAIAVRQRCYCEACRDCLVDAPGDPRERTRGQAQVLGDEFERVHWLVPGERIAAGLRERGLSAPLLQAESAEDHDLVAALVRWRSNVSGA